MSAPPGRNLSAIPLIPPPPGVVSNLENPVSHGDFRPIYLFFSIIGGLFVLMRLYTRVFISRSVGTDDYVSGLGMLFYFAFFGVSWILTRDYQMHHAWDLSITYMVPRFFKVDLAAFLLFAPANVCIKSSIFLLYLRVFKSTRYMKWLSWFMISFIVTFHIASVLAVAFSCNPRRKILNPLVPGKCINRYHLAIANAALNIFTDLMAFALPIRPVMGLNTSRRQKLQVLAVFATGLFACVVCVLRLLAFIRTAQTADFTWNGYYSLRWTIIELNVATLCACAAAFRPFCIHHISQASSLFSRSTHKSASAISKEVPPRLLDRKNDNVYITTTIARTVDTIELGQTSSSRQTPPLNLR